MNRDQAHEVAENLDATPELLPYLGELLADVWALGCSPQVAIELLRGLGLEPGSTRVLDLATGKGAMAIPIAVELGWSVDGVDLYPPFIAEARARAASAGIGERCRFEVADLRRCLSPASPYDVVIYASVGALGRLDEAVGRLRGAVRSGGHLLIDDGFLATAPLERPGYGHYVPYDETVARLTRCGDRIVAEVRRDPEEARRENLEITAAIRARAEQLCSRHPDQADLFREFVARQEEECAVLDAEFMGTTWLLERAPTQSQ